MKIVISNKNTSYQTEILKDKEPMLYGMHVGSELDGSLVGAAGYKLKIRGGSDKDGFPMRADLPGTGRKRIMLHGSPGYRGGEKGEMVRRPIRGNTVSEAIAQLNVIVLESGPTPLDKLFPKTEKKKE